MRYKLIKALIITLKIFGFFIYAINEVILENPTIIHYNKLALTYLYLDAM